MNNLFNNAKWIGDSEFDYKKNDLDYFKSNPNPIFIKEFNLDIIEKTNIYISNLGMYICFINGKRISSYELNYDWTNNAKLVYYDVIDITDYLQVGNNMVEIEMGNGMINPAPLSLFSKYNLRDRLEYICDPKLLVSINKEDKQVLVSDESWKVKQGNLTFNNYYMGEYYDSEISSNTKDVTIYDLNNFNLLKESKIEKCEITKELKAIEVFDHKEGFVFDFGETISGFIDIKIDLKEDKNITLLYSETKEDDGSLNLTSAVCGNIGMQIKDFIISGGEGTPAIPYQEDRLRLNKGMHSFRNKFTFHSFRYVYIKGLSYEDVKGIKALRVNTKLEQISNINTDNKYYNDLFKAGINTKLNNIHSAFEDCAREKLAYGGDMICLMPSNSYIFNLDEILRKTILDFKIEQTKEGGIPETAPYMGIQTKGTADMEGPILWQYVYPFLIELHYNLFNDLTILSDNRDSLIKQVDYLNSIDIEVVKHNCIGDHGSPEIVGDFAASTPDKEFVGVCTMLLFNQTLINLLDKLKVDNSKYILKYNELKEYLDVNYKNEDNTYGDATQTSLAFSYKLNLMDKESLKLAIKNKFKNDNYILTTGIFGASFMYEALNDLDLNYIVSNWLNNDSEIGFKKMLHNGNKVLSELFVAEGNNYYSCNHAMFSSYHIWYYQALCGIVSNDNFKTVIIKPYFDDNLNELNSSINTKYGKLNIKWTRFDDKVVYELTDITDIDYSFKEVHGYNKIEYKNENNVHRFVYERSN